MKRFKYRCEHTLSSTIVRLCDCNRMYQHDNNLMFDMKYVWFPKEHPFNPYGKAYRTGRAGIILENITLGRCVLTKSNAKTVEITSPDTLFYDDVMIHEWEEVDTETGFRAVIHILFNNTDENYSLLMEIEYKKSVTLWNGFKTTSWFEEL